MNKITRIIAIVTTGGRDNEQVRSLSRWPRYRSRSRGGKCSILIRRRYADRRSTSKRIKNQTRGVWNLRPYRIDSRERPNGKKNLVFVRTFAKILCFLCWFFFFFCYFLYGLHMSPKSGNDKDNDNVLCVSIA